MDSNESQENDGNKGGFTKPIENQQEQPEQAIRESTKKYIQKLNQRKNQIDAKLSKTHDQLKLKKNDFELKNGKKKQNDEKAVRSLQLLAGRVPVSSKNCTELPESTSKARVESKHVQSKEKLEAIVKGYEMLISKLISNNRTLLSLFRNAAQEISILKDLPFFENIEKECKKAKAVKKTKQKNVLEREKIEKNGELTLKEKFSKYINSILREHIGSDRKDNLEKYKCLPEHIDDLESFADSLVKAGYGKIVEEEIRISSKNNHQGFITMSTSRETNEKDAIISSPVARRYAFDGDIVRAFVLNADPVANRRRGHSSSNTKEQSRSLSICEDTDENGEIERDSSNELDSGNGDLDTSLDVVIDKEICRKAFVIRIIKQTELREVVGSITLEQTTLIDSEEYYKLRPHDTKIPMVFIPKEMCKEELNNVSKEDVCGMLYVARILDIDTHGHCIGELVQPVGKVGNLEAEIKAILLNNNLKDLKPYDQKYQDMFDGSVPPVNDDILKHREDLRKKCVFTIDPLTAKDLDDAVSVERLNDSEYEIGVHISDVSFYLQENTELDNLVKHRATSVYLVDRVIHMLPSSLCLKCSLLPGEDKFAFSVFWKWHEVKREMSTPRFTRTIINSCTQLAYEHAQKIIDNPMEDIDNNDLPDVLNGWTPNDIKWRVLLLQYISEKLREKRYENGALTLNNPKLRFQLDPKSGEPLDFEIEDRREANFLIEELMLLANQSVAKFIHDYFPDKSILRNHSPPMAKGLKSLRDRLKSVGLIFDTTSSKSIYNSMYRLIFLDAEDPKAMEAGLNSLLTKPMARAKYFCSEGMANETDLWHYALSIPIYTHFTSPIRRYADILVHRLLAAALNYCPPPQRTTDELHHLAKIMNDQKLNAKKAGDDSIELFFKRYLKAKQLITVSAVVTEIGQHAVNVVSMDTGHSISIAYNLQEYVVITRNVPDSVLICKRHSKMPSKNLHLFSRVDINLVLVKDKICGSFAIFEEPQYNLAIENCNKTASENNVLRNNQQQSKSSTSAKSIKQNNESKVTKKDKKMKDYLAFYAVKN